MLTIVKSLKNRPAAPGRHLGSASSYLKRLAASLGMNELAGHLGINRAELKQAIKQAANKLTWFDEENAEPKAMWLPGGNDGANSRVKGTPIGKADDSYKLTEGSLLDFDCVVTTGRRDRDGDVLDPKGAIVDLKAPLLWQHIPFQPIGRHVQLLEQTEKRVASRCMVASTGLGNDAAVLVEAGCLRISHGFSPIEYIPLKDDNGKDMGGWHIQKYAMMEISLVSIPSNVDAEIQAFSRGKLHSPLMKAWGKMLNAERPKFFPTGGQVGPVEVKLTLDLKGLPGVKAEGDDEDDEDEDDDEASVTDTEGTGAKGDDKPKEDEEGKGKKGDESEGEGTAKAGKVLGDLIDSVRTMAKEADLPKEASRRLAVCEGMLEDIETNIAASADSISEAAKNRDLVTMFVSMGDLVDSCAGSLLSVNEEIQRVAGIEGLSEACVKGCKEFSDSATRMVEAVRTMSGKADDLADGSGDQPAEAAEDDEDKTDEGNDIPAATAEEGGMLGDEDDDEDDSELEERDEESDEEKEMDEDEEKAEGTDDGVNLDPDENEIDPDEENPGVEERSAKPKRKRAEPMDELLGRHLRGEKLGSTTVAALEKMFGSK